MNRCIRASVTVLCGLIGVAGTGSAAESALDFTHAFSRAGMSTNLYFMRERPPPVTLILLR